MPQTAAPDPRPFRRPHQPLPEPERAPRLERISDYPRYWARALPAREAVVSEGRRWGYRELADRVDACARGLIAAGVRPGDRVATLAPPSPDFFVTFLATASIGAIWLGLNPRYQPRELQYVLADADPRLVFARRRIGERVFDRDLPVMAAESASSPAIVWLDADSDQPDDAPGNASGHPALRSYRGFLAAGDGISAGALDQVRAGVAGASPCLIVYTSGTTGQPKGALIHHRGLVEVARIQHAVWPVDPIRVINNLPINHIGCVGDLTCDTLVPGGTLVFQERFDPVEMLALVPRERITLFGHVPTALQLVVNDPSFETTDFSSVRLIVWSGAAAPTALIERLQAKCPEVANAYGMTETVGSVTFTFDSDDRGVLGESVGWPAPDYQVRIATPDGQAVLAGDPGEIQVRSDCVTLGYWRRPEATAELFTADGWLRTGDLAEERPDGAYRLIGRLKEMYKSGGYNVYPREIELVLERHPAVAMAAVIGVSDPLYQEVGHAFVMVQPHQQVDALALERHCRIQLANYKVPKRITIADALPMLPIGKIDKQALRHATE